MESKEFKALKEQLLSCRRNGFDRMDAAERSAMESYCTDYKAFLDTSKTERLCAGEVVRLAEQAGYRPYVRGAAAAQGREIPLKPQGAARYTVPVSLCPQRMGEQLVVRFRVGRNIRGGVVKVFAGDKLLYQRKRPVMAPGEMEQVVFQKAWFTGGEAEIRLVAEEEEAQ